MAFPSDRTSKRVLVTGASGFTGRYVIAALTAAGHEVVDLNDGSSGSVDLLDKSGLQRAVAKAGAQVVIHLAAIAFVAHGDVEELYRVNIVGTRNLLETLTETGSIPEHVILASSANVYGNAGGRLSESTPPQPTNDYAVSKLAMELMARQFADRLPMTIVRPFNYTGVGQSQRFLIPKIVSHFRQRAEYLELGNVDVARDFNDVRNVAAAYVRLAGIPGVGDVYNICSGEGQTLLGVLEMMEAIAGYRPQIVVNPAYVRSNEVKRLIGDPSKFNALAGDLQQWKLKETLQWMYDSMIE